jgi:hypothetical protein
MARKILSYADFKAINTGVKTGGKSHMKSCKGKEGWKTLSEKKEEGVQIFNQTDSVYVSKKIFPTTEAARKFVDKYLDTYNKQGFYMTAKGDRIKPEEIRLILQPADRKIKSKEE